MWKGRPNGAGFSEATGQKLDALVVLGGDGTIRTAAERCTKEGLYLIPLPGGTLNMLSRALYGDVSWEDALKNTLAAPSTRVLSGGRVADKQFFIAAILGAPSLWTDARESIREGEVVDAIKKGASLFNTCLKRKCSISFQRK